jgi:hypothetical protein
MQSPTTTEELSNRLVELLKKDPSDIAPIITQLRNHTGKGGLIEPGDDSQQSNTWGVIFQALSSNGLFRPAEDVAITWYYHLCQLQFDNDERYHKGTPTQHCGNIGLLLGENARANWFFTMAFVEDVLSSSDEDIPGLPATQSLRLHFGRSDAELRIIAETARSLKADDDLWQYPELAAVSVARDGRVVTSSFKGTAEIPISKPFLRILLDRLSEGGTDAKKKSLEFLASYLTITLPGVRLEPNARTLEHEIDLVVVQHAPSSSYLLEALGRSFLVECKNWEKPIGVEQLNHFVAKMRFHRCMCGVIFSREGLSGDRVPGKGLSYARLTQLRWWQQDACVVIVLTDEDLKTLLDTGQTFGNLLLRGYESIKFSNKPGDRTT